ncbi:hypothetical protein O6H91_04G083100 [Diphasiastrum complanatum]|uniref:Uncharacterized protein n=1 Tax=Diphasiastrum complanatum TaxID=34168 RepID=A0ACC2DYT5_DIPCM|nr:hypothetical protein O6H91_04G083100 [Diphasiastrum complanatum]
MGNRGQVSTAHSKTTDLMTSKPSHIIAKGNVAGGADWPKAQRPPLIKVVHIFNPTVFKTDAANFRSLVQKLTGRNYKPRMHPASKSHRKAARVQGGDHLIGIPPPIFDTQQPKDGANVFHQDQFAGCYSFADSVLNMPLSESSDSEYSDQKVSSFEVSHATGDYHNRSAFVGSSDSEYSDQKAPIFEVNYGKRDYQNPSEPAQMYSIPERLSFFNELDMEPLPDCTMLPPLTGIPSDQGMLNSMQRFSTFFNVLESFSCK